MHKHANRILSEVLRVINPRQCVKKSMCLKKVSGDWVFKVGLNSPRPSSISLSQYNRILVLGVGKASIEMASATEDMFLKAEMDNVPVKGLVITKHGHAAGSTLRNIDVIESGHPISDDAGAIGASKMLSMASEADKDTLVVMCISGGGSALACLPAEGLTLEDMHTVTQELLFSGVTISDMNIIRKHISKFSGGQLALAVHPARLVTVVLSDVIGDSLSSIASGPTKGIRGEIPDTPTSDHSIFKVAAFDSFVIGNNKIAINAAKRIAVDLGYDTLILSTDLQGEAKDIGELYSSLAKQIRAGDHSLKPPACIITGGETTVSIPSHCTGKGGRNQEVSLSAGINIQNMKNVIIMSVGTDGTDGPTDAAGACVDGKMCEISEKKGLDPLAFLQNHDSYNFFRNFEISVNKDFNQMSNTGLVITGPTGSNVMDIAIVLVGKSDCEGKQ